jgi:hypothetical protein
VGHVEPNCRSIRSCFRFRRTVNGFLGGAQVGFNWQLNSWLVLGAEGQFSWADVDGSTPCLVVVKCTSQVNWIATAAGRIGYTFDRTMLFAKVGVAWADTDYSATFGPFSATASDTRTGLMIGAGVEHAFCQNWSAKIEYNYMDFDTESLGTAADPADVVSGAGRYAPCLGSSTINADITQRIHSPVRPELSVRGALRGHRATDWHGGLLEGKGRWCTGPFDLPVAAVRRLVGQTRPYQYGPSPILTAKTDDACSPAAERRR